MMKISPAFASTTQGVYENLHNTWNTYKWDAIIGLDHLPYKNS